MLPAELEEELVELPAGQREASQPAGQREAALPAGLTAEALLETPSNPLNLTYSRSPLLRHNRPFSVLDLPAELSLPAELVEELPVGLPAELVEVLPAVLLAAALPAVLLETPATLAFPAGKDDLLLRRNQTAQVLGLPAQLLSEVALSAQLLSAQLLSEAQLLKMSACPLRQRQPYPPPNPEDLV